MAMGDVAACWGVPLALQFRTQCAAPLMQAGMFILVLTTTAYAPLALLQGWLADVAKINPLTQVVEAARQGFLGDDHLGGDLAGPARARRPDRRARRARPARHAPDRPTERRARGALPPRS